MDRLLEKLRDMGPKAVLVVLAAALLFAGVVVGAVIGVVETNKANRTRERNEAIRMEEVRREQRALSILDALYSDAKENASAALPGFLLLGDDLSAGAGVSKSDYAVALQQAITDEILNTFRFSDAVPEEFRRVVQNNEKRYSLPEAQMTRNGIAGASTDTLLSVDGAYDIVTTEAITVPAGTESVAIKFRSGRGDLIDPLCSKANRQIAVYLTPDDGEVKVLGTLSVRTTSNPVEYQFTRETAAEEPTVLPAGSKIVTRRSLENRDLFPIVWMGMNGGYDTVEELIEQHIALLSDKPLYAEGYYLVIGLLDSTPAEEAAFEAAFGDHYLNARAFLNQLGLSNEGLKPEDRTAVENGEVPLYLRDKYDAARAPFYLNRDGYAAIGREAFRMIDATGYFDAIRGVIAEAMAEAAAINN